MTLREPHLQEDTQGECLPQPDQARAAAGIGVIVPIPGPLIVVIATPSIRAPAATVAPAIADVVILRAAARAGAPPPARSGEAVRRRQHPPRVHKAGGPACHSTCHQHLVISSECTGELCPLPQILKAGAELAGPQLLLSALTFKSGSTSGGWCWLHVLKCC